MIGRNTNSASVSLANEKTIEETCATFKALELQRKNMEPEWKAAKQQLVLHAKANDNMFEGSQLKHPNGVTVKKSLRVTTSFDESKMSTSWIDAFLGCKSADAISVSFDPKKIRPDDTRALALLQEVDYAEHATVVYSVCVNQ